MTLIALMRTRSGARAAAGTARGAAKPRGPLAMVLAVLLALGVAVPGLAQAPTARPVVLELYTSQGCASCPPADEMMLELAAREDVIALALHVDYWDYIGWPDTFGRRLFTERQQGYARRHGHSTIYTPQVVVNGVELIEGFRTMQVMESIADHALRPVEVTLVLARGEGGTLRIEATPEGHLAPGLAMASRRGAVTGITGSAVIGSLSMSNGVDSAAPTGGAAAGVADDDASLAAEATTEAAPLVAAPTELVPVRPTGPYVVQLVRYLDSEVVEILGGENAGRTTTYANIVTTWMPVANWDMQEALSLTLPLTGEEAVVVLIQEAGQGEVIAAARLR